MTTETNKKKSQKLTSVQKYGESIRYRALVNLAIIIYIIAAIFIINQRANVRINQHYVKMKDLLNTFVETYNTEYVQELICLQVDEDNCDYYVKMLADLFERKGVSQELITKIQEELLDDGTLYCVTKGGKIISAPNSPRINLPGNIIAVLKKYGTYVDKENSKRYSYAKTKAGDGVLISWKPITYNMSSTLKSDVWGSDYSTYTVDSSGDIIASNDEMVIYQKYSNVHCEEEYSNFFTKKLKESIDRCGICEDKNGKKHFYLERTETIEDKPMIFCVQISLRDIANEVMHYISIQLALMVLVFVLVVRTTIFLTSHVASSEEEGIDKSGDIILGVDINRFSHMTALFIVCIVTTVLLTIYNHILTGYSGYYIQATNSLNNILSKEDHYEENYQQVEQAFSDFYVDTAELLAYLMKLDPAYGTNESLKETSKRLSNFFSYDVEDMQTEITVYNKDGISVASNIGYVGYKLSTDPNNYESECWKLLSNTQEYLISGMDDPKNNTCFVAVKRQDETGIIIFEVNNEQFKYLKSYYTMSEAVNCTSFGQILKMYIKNDNPLVVNVPIQKLDSNYCYMGEVEYMLDESILSGKYEGEYRLAKPIVYDNSVIAHSGLYYINELKTDDATYISMISVYTILKEAMAGVLSQLICYAILFVMVMIYMNYDQISGRNHKKEKKPHDRKHFYRGIMNDLFQKDLRTLFIGTATIVIGIAMIEHLIFYSKVLNFLYGSRWAHTFNLFSVTKILIAILVVNIIGIAMIRFIELISKNVGNRFETIGKMICSLIRFGVVAFLVIYGSVQFGAKLSYLLTGAGFMGIVIGYAGQSLISDLLNGLFIVFEGKIRVGDWISVDDWRGQVVEIGVRTTSVTYGGDIRVFNNSCLNTVTVWSHSMSGALCMFRVSYETNVDQIVSLILANKDRYLEEIPGIIDGPGVNQITELGDDGVAIRIWATPEDESMVADIDQGLYVTTKKIFQENGITMPLTRVLLSETKMDQEEKNKKL